MKFQLTKRFSDQRNYFSVTFLVLWMEVVVHIRRLRVIKDMIDDESDCLREQGGGSRCLEEYADSHALGPTEHSTETFHQGFMV